MLDHETSELLTSDSTNEVLSQSNPGEISARNYLPTKNRAMLPIQKATILSPLLYTLI